MSNRFINYLNSMNNASSSNINSLAESQVLNEFYHTIQVERNLGKYIAKEIKEKKNECFILTGHAGDGKTSILVQVLRELELLERGSKLEEYKQINHNGVNLLYIKDMSELNREDQIKYLKKSLEAPSNGSSSILITNTGPLLTSFKALFDNDTSIENELLDQLDLNKNDYLSLNGYKFKLINIARVDNVGFSREILKKLTYDILWNDCEKCEYSNVCHVCTNYKCVKDNFDRVANFVESYYRYLYENDKRVTIRQILSQLSFAFTGNMSCEEIRQKKSKTIRFTHNFANLFFGYEGIKEIESSNQIKAIKELRLLDIDSRSLAEDYNMIVRNNFNCFDEDIKKIVKSEWERFSKKYRKSNGEANDRLAINNNDEDVSMRRALRRYYLMYSRVENEEQMDDVINQVFGSIFSLYHKGLFNKYCKKESRELKNLVFRALYINNMGVPPKSKEDLYLTLKRNDGSFQNVFLEIGRVRTKDIDIVQDAVNNEFDDIVFKNELFIELGSDKNSRFLLTLPILNYFKSISDGAIVTSVNPILGHGIARLNSMLLEKFNTDEDIDENEFRLIINTLSETINIKITIEDDELCIE
ncbi:MAG: hypothetical protein KIB00_00425 [Paeniclostridium sordellii]|nr:hypothetical protein [Paeniclostridium sordellii]